MNQRIVALTYFIMGISYLLVKPVYGSLGLVVDSANVSGTSLVSLDISPFRALSSSGIWGQRQLNQDFRVSFGVRSQLEVQTTLGWSLYQEQPNTYAPSLVPFIGGYWRQDGLYPVMGMGLAKQLPWDSLVGLNLAYSPTFNYQNIGQIIGNPPQMGAYLLKFYGSWFYTLTLNGWGESVGVGYRF
jgi:hypothetical protein